MSTAKASFIIVAMDVLDVRKVTVDHSAAPPLLQRLTPVLILGGACWLMFVLNNLMFHGHFTQYGIIPRRVSSLPGIVWSPFLHFSFKHLAANTVPLLVLGAIICARNRKEFTLITIFGITLTGALTWLIGRNAIHIGASGLVFCFFGYLASLALFNRDFPTLLLSVACLLGYGGMLRGVLPTSAPVSWESHLAGALSGIVLAWFTSKLKETPNNEGTNPSNIPSQPPAP